jgi:sugar transferase (PEP-CTERM/EpsH1 system associated)
MTPDPRPLVAHVMYRFDVGGLENGIVNLINHFPESAYRHAIVALTEVTDFKLRIRRQDVSFHALHKAPGHGIKLFPQLYRLFRELRPAIVHTRNLAALEAAVPAWAAGVRARVHGEHGRDVGDPDGHNRKYQWVRRLYSPFVSRYIALSKDLEGYLTDRVGIAARRVSQVYNGVDTERFHPTPTGREPIEGCPFTDPSLWLVGTVGRMQEIKDQVNLARAFVHALAMKPRSREKLRLIMIGEGPLKVQVEQILSDAGVRDLAWLPGKLDDVAHLLRGMDGFVLPSRAEGISNTILEAMASGLPVIATDVVGNGELLVSDETGELVPAENPEALAAAILRQYLNPVVYMAMGRAGRTRVERLFSMDSMVRSYLDVYDGVLGLPGSRRTV